MGISVLGIKIYDNFNKILDSGSSLQLNLVRCPQVVPLCTITWSHQAHPALTKLVSWPWTASMLIHMCEQETLVFSDYYICLFLFAPTLPLFLHLLDSLYCIYFLVFVSPNFITILAFAGFSVFPVWAQSYLSIFLFFSVLYLLFFAELYHYLIVSLYSLSESFLSIWLCFLYCICLFLDKQVTLATTHVRCPSISLSRFWISILSASLDSHRTSAETCDLWDIWSEWWGKMSQGCMEAWMFLGLGCMEAAMLGNVWWQQCSSKIYTDGQRWMQTEIWGCWKE